MKRTNNQGFTIIELLIATVTFSLVLLVITGAIIQFGRIYYKGVVQSRTQERVRAIADDISKSLQFGREFSTGANYICAGGKKFTYQLGTKEAPRQVGVNSHVMVVQPDCSSPPVSMDSDMLPAGATELLGERMQLTHLDVAETEPGSGAYTVNIRVVYGQNIDFEDEDPTRPCNAITLGGQFCSVAQLTTTVMKRL